MNQDNILDMNDEVFQKSISGQQQRTIASIKEQALCQGEKIKAGCRIWLFKSRYEGRR